MDGFPVCQFNAIIKPKPLTLFLLLCLIYKEASCVERNFKKKPNKKKKMMPQLVQFSHFLLLLFLNRLHRLYCLPAINSLLNIVQAAKLKGDSVLAKSCHNSSEIERHAYALFLPLAWLNYSLHTCNLGFKWPDPFLSANACYTCLPVMTIMLKKPRKILLVWI